MAKKQIPIMSELRLAETKRLILEDINDKLVKVLSTYEDIWLDMETDEYDTLYSAHKLLDAKIDALRKDEASIANKLKHIRP